MVSSNRFFTTAVAFASASIALALPTSNATIAPSPLTCGSDTPPLATVAAVADESRLVFNATAAAFAPVSRTIYVYWNVIYKDTTYAGGYLTLPQVRAAVSTLNQHFTGSGLTFYLLNVRYYKSADWFSNVDNGSELTTAMKSLLHRGAAKDLNIYSVGFLTSSLGGFATYPWWYVGAPLLDGVVFKWNTIPGGTLAGYDQGKILVHEVGHWAGLYHTFEGGCSSATGDYVSDTPAEYGPVYGCPPSSDSCPSLPGQDPIHNFMDYTYDMCKTAPFTLGQFTRMSVAVSNYRAN